MAKKRTVEQIKEDLILAKRRLRAVEELGDEVISKYDLEFGYNADFYLNRCPLLANHVKYYERELNKAMENHQLSLF